MNDSLQGSSRRFITKFLFLIGLFGCFTGSLRAQSPIIPGIWYNQVYDARVIGLGQANDILSGNAGNTVNPAVLSEPGLLRLNYNFSRPTLFTSSRFVENPGLINSSFTASFDEFSISVLLNYLSLTYQDSFGINQQFRNAFSRVNFGFRLSDHWSSGLGVSFIRSSGSNMEGAINAGVYYSNIFETDNLIISPEAGFTMDAITLDDRQVVQNTTALINVVDPMTQFPLTRESYQFPSQLKLSGGLRTKMRREYLSRSVVGVGLYAGVRKYLTRYRYNQGGGISDDIYQSSFKSIITGWKPFTTFVNGQETDITVLDQISGSLGLEISFIETLHLRYGVQQGAEFWVNNYQSLGLGLDLYYIRFDFSRMYFEDPGFRSRYIQHDQNIWQLTLRIPVDGKKRDTLLSRILR